MEISTYKCPCCGAPITFDSTLQEMKCNACGTVFQTEQLEQFADAAAAAEPENEFHWDSYNGKTVDGTVTYTCPSCGGEIIGDANTAATKCPYCDNVAILDGQLSGMLKPDLVIPFGKTKADAKAALKNFYKGKKLLPNRFLDMNHIEDITGIYVPFWLFDCDTDAHITYDATRVSTWSDKRFRYTKTDHFLILREGKLGFTKVPVDASTRMDDALMDSIEPFDYSKAVDFGTAYLSGFFADKYDVDSKQSLPRANDRVVNSVLSTFASTVHGYASVIPKNHNVRTENGKMLYALMPVWILNTKYEGKLYTFAMNGQTGKFVGSLPIDWGKFWRRFFAVLAGVFVPLMLAIILGGGLL